jgi:AraC-like DNA-binding protein
MIHLYVPLQSLHALADGLGVRRIDTLDLPVTTSRFDPTMYHLATSLLPALQDGADVSGLFIDYVLEAACVHLAETYGGMSFDAAKWRAGLAPWQERRAKEMLLSDLRIEPSLGDLAAACGLSTRHFSRAFKGTTGAPPHQWLLRQKVEQAKNLLWKSNKCISAIALDCGFADQSHLTRVFRRHMGLTPAVWRRERNR